MSGDRLIVIGSIVAAAIAAALVLLGVLPWWTVLVAVLAVPALVAVFCALVVLALMAAWAAERRQ